MIKVMAYELNYNRIDCLFDWSDEYPWSIVYQGHKETDYYKTFQEASERMDEAIRDLNNLDN